MATNRTAFTALPDSSVERPAPPIMGSTNFNDRARTRQRVHANNPALDNIRKHLPELYARANWVGRDGNRWINPHDLGIASRLDQRTQGTFDEVRAGLLKREYPGIGFAISPPYTVIKFKKCVDPTTGTINAFASEWVSLSLLASYSERVGADVHVWIRAQPFTICTHPLADVYSRHQFVQVTGELLPERALDRICERQDIVDSLIQRLRPESRADLNCDAYVLPWVES